MTLENPCVKCVTFYSEEVGRKFLLGRDIKIGSKVRGSTFLRGDSEPEDIAKIFIEALKRFEEVKKIEGVVDYEKEYKSQ